MKRLIYTIMGFVLLSVAITACKEDDDTVLSSNCSIKNFTLGQLKREIQYTDTTGKDTFYVISFSGSYYPLHIDQVKQTILLRSPLPTGTRLGAVLASASFEGALFYRAWDPSPEDTAWHAFSTSDSIDFRQPLRFRVSSTDGSSYRDYYLRLDCRTNEASAYTWTKVNDDCCPASDERRLLAWKDTLFLMTRNTETGQCAWQWSVASDQTPLGKVWTAVAESQSVNADPQTLSSFHDKLWLSSADGRELWTFDKADHQLRLHHSFDGASGLSALTLFASSDRALYGIGTTDGGQRAIFQSTDGNTWTSMAADDDMNLFPTTPTSVAYTQVNANERVLVAGAADGGTADTCEVWSLLEGSAEPWTYFTPAPDNPYRLPVLADLNIISYNNLLLAFGGASAKGRKALSVCYVSHDNGITWRTDGDLNIPDALKGTDGRIAAATYDGDIWVCAGKEIWRARLNSYGETE